MCGHGPLVSEEFILSVDCRSLFKVNLRILSAFFRRKGLRDDSRFYVRVPDRVRAVGVGGGVLLVVVGGHRLTVNSAATWLEDDTREG